MEENFTDIQAMARSKPATWFSPSYGYGGVVDQETLVRIAESIK